MNDLRIALLQTRLEWENPGANREHIARQFADVRPGEADILVLPEMFTTGFSMTPERIAEPVADRMESLEWLRSWSSRLNAVITGSIAVNESGQYFNRLYWVRPDGSFSTYDKRHLFRMAGEDQHYSAGGRLLVEEWKGWNICPLICYDLRFPVWGRNRLISGRPMYDLLIYVANWPEARREPWKKLAVARAIENQCYVAAVNRLGKDGNGLDYSGDSSIIDPRGNYLVPPDSSDGWLLNSLSRADLEEFREKFPVLSDADHFDLIP